MSIKETRWKQRFKVSHRSRFRIFKAFTHMAFNWENFATKTKCLRSYSFQHELLIMVWPVTRGSQSGTGTPYSEQYSSRPNSSLLLPLCCFSSSWTFQVLILHNEWNTVNAVFKSLQVTDPQRFSSWYIWCLPQIPAWENLCQPTMG